MAKYFVCGLLNIIIVCFDVILMVYCIVCFILPFMPFVIWTYQYIVFALLFILCKYIAKKKKKKIRVLGLQVI